MKKLKKHVYPKEVQDNAALYGFKTANLINLQKVLRGFPRKPGDIAVAVPTFQALSDEDIKLMLIKIVPGWEERWKQFVTQFNEDNAHNLTAYKTLSPASLNILAALQNDIEQGFAGDNGLKLSDELTSNMLMVRSTGREDDVDVANPGGNASYPSKNDPISASQVIGKVNSSYFDKKSLSQRLAAGLDITGTPFTPGLVQHFVGEGISNRAGMITSDITSGVIYSNNGATSIDAAPGHGELVVNSKGPVDSFYITKTGVVFPERRAKPFRIKPVFDEVSGKLSLEITQNSITKEYGFSLNGKVVRTIHRLAQYIEASYGMPMDTEFVYDHEARTIYVVQTRPIPEGKRAALAPSALDPELISQCPAKHTGHTITRTINTAIVIKDNKEIFVCDYIEEALNYYLYDPNGKNIKAVIVKNNAPSTSHEAGEFSSVAIPVIQIDNIAVIEEMLKSLRDQHLVIDPQRKTVFQLSKELSSEGAMLLKEGLFKSSISSDVSLFNQTLRAAVSLIPPVEISEDGKRISEILAGIKSPNKGVAKRNMYNLLHYIDNNIQGAEPFSNQVIEAGKVRHQIDMNQLREALDQMQNLSRDNIEHNRKNLIRIMRSIRAIHKADIGMSHPLFRQIMIAGAAGLALIDEISIQEQKEPSSHPLYSEYLDIYEKIYGMINGNGNAEVLGNCLKGELAQRKLENKAKNMIEEENFSEEQRELFTQSLKFSRYCLNDKLKEKWEKFCLEACKTVGEAQHLRNIIGNVAHMNIHEKWINISFAMQEGDEKAILDNLSQELQVIHEHKPNLAKIDSIILSLKSSTEQWKSPEKFDQLLKELHEKVAYIRENVKFDASEPMTLQIMKANQMNELVDVMDLTLKSLGTSGLYGNDDKAKTTQAQNFSVVLEEFYKLLEIWSSGRGNRWARQAILTKAASFAPDRYDASARDLSLSGRFNVSTANINANIVGELGWGRILGPCTTLQDAFTLIHQNLINTIASLTSGINDVITSQLPKKVGDIAGKMSSFGFTTEVRVGEVDLVAHGALMAASIENAKVKLQYNLPLRNHSAMFDIVYDNYTKKTCLNFITFGHNGGGRWTFAAAALNYDLEQKHGLKFVKKAKHNADTQLMSFSIDVSELTPEKLNSVLQSINDNCIVLSFSDIRSNQATSNLLQELLQDKFELLINADAVAAYNSKGVTFEYLKELEIDRIRILASSNATAAYETGKVTVQDLLADNIIDIKRNILRAYAEHIGKEARENLNYIDRLVDEAKIDQLISGQAVNAYKTGNIIAQDLVSLDIEKIKLLVSDQAINACKIGNITMHALLAEDIIDIKRNILRVYAEHICKEARENLNYIDRLVDEAKIDQLISGQAINAYKASNITTQDLIDLDIEKIKLLVSDQAINAYKAGNITARDLGSLEIEKIKLLISAYAISAYETGKVTARDLIDLDGEKIKLLTSDHAINVYKVDNITARDLIGLDIEKIKLLVSYDAINVYKADNITARDLIDLDIEKIKLLVSYDAFNAYRAGRVTGQDLVDLDTEKIKLLISYEIINVCKIGNITIRDLLAEDIAGIKRNILRVYAEHICKEARENLNYIDRLVDEAKIDQLISGQVIYAYETGKVTVRDLIGLDTEKIKLLISDQAISAYETGKVAAQDLVGLDTEKIKLLISDQAISAYKTGKVAAQDLVGLDTEKIKLLISDQAINAYKTGKVAARNLIDLDEEKIKLLTSYQAINAYESGKVAAQDLADLNGEKIKLLASYQATNAYETGKIAAQDLADLEVEKIKLLISYKAINAYETGKVIAQDLINLEAEKIRLLISDQAINAYKTGKIAAQDLIDLDKEKIKLLTSSAAIKIYNNWGAEDSARFNNLSAKDAILINALSKAIGTQLFQEDSVGKRQTDIKLIESTLSDIVNSIRLRNPKFDIANLYPGEVKYGVLGKAKSEGLSKMFYDCCSYTTVGYITKGVCLEESLLTESFKTQIASYFIKQSNIQSCDMVLE